MVRSLIFLLLFNICFAESFIYLGVDDNGKCITGIKGKYFISDLWVGFDVRSIDVTARRLNRLSLDRITFFTELGISLDYIDIYYNHKCTHCIDYRDEETDSMIYDTIGVNYKF